jgi:hypothetical protein
LKENFTQLDPQTILNKIQSLSITQWNYKTEPIGTTHIGPVAQDFYALFNVGGASGETSISTVDPSGVALLGIQALNLNLGAISGTITPITGSTQESFMNSFFDNVYAKVSTWLASATNGIERIFVKEVNTDTLCVSDATGAKTCISKTQLDDLLAGAGSASGTISGGDVCVDDVCITKEQFKQILINGGGVSNNQAPAPKVTNEATPKAEDGEATDTPKTPESDTPDTTTSVAPAESATEVTTNATITEEGISAPSLSTTESTTTTTEQPSTEVN